MMKRYLYIHICLLLMVLAPTAYAQQSTIKGNIQNAYGQPVEGATITLMENPSIKTASNAEGAFTIRGEVGQHLRITKENELGETVPITQKEITINLGNSSRAIPIGYGEVRGPDELTAAVGAIGSSQISDNSSAINPANALYGKIPGLTVLQNGGGPPTNPNLYIRGRETFTNSSPLVLVDGFERPLSSLSPREIKDITVLKDAAAVAMYGQRGANGVLLVTTKRGSAGPLRVNASYEQRITQPTASPDFLEAPAYARARNEALTNDGESPRYTQNDLERFDSGTSPYLYPNVDWSDEVLRNYGTRSNFNVTFEGGGGTARYFALVNYVQDNGILDPVSSIEDFSTQKKYRRFNFRSNVDIDITDNLLFQVNIGGNLFNNNIPAGGDNFGDIFNAIYSIPSAAFPVRTPSGNWGGTQVYGNNPVAIQTATGSGGPNARELFVDGSLKQDLDMLTEGLTAEVTVSYTNYASYFEQQQKQYSYEALSPVTDDEGNIVDTTSVIYGEDTDLNFIDSFGEQRRQANLLGKLDYEKSLGDDELEAMVLFHQDSRILDGFDNVYHRRNFAANVHYGVDGKYFFDVAASYSGNNLLPEGSRYNFFPAVSAAWLISNESFLDNSSFLDVLKLRGSWGMSGNDLLPTNTPHMQSFNGGPGYWFQNGNNFQGGFTETRLATSDFDVETSYNTNIGLEAGLFGKLNLTADLFYARRTNIMTGTAGQISDVIGIAEPLETDGVVENKGVEVALDWQDGVGDFTYHIGGQFSFARNKIVEMNETYRPYSYLERTGQQVGQRFGLQAIGFFEDQQDIADSPQQVFAEVRPGDIKYKDQNGDGVINQFDEVPLGYSSGYPEMYFSASLGLQYKGIEFSALFQGTGNYSAYLNTQSVYWPLRNNTTISNYYYNRRWTPETAGSATLPRLTAGDNANNLRPNSVWLVDRSYVKLRTVEVAYSFPVSIVESWNLDNIQIFAKGHNLFSIDDVPVLDPEYLSAGYPILRSYNLGIDIAF